MNKRRTTVLVLVGLVLVGVGGWRIRQGVMKRTQEERTVRLPDDLPQPTREVPVEHGVPEATRRAVAEARQTGKHPERLTALIPPKPFDPEAFERDPEGYLAIPEPGRVFQTGKPSPSGTVYLKAFSSPHRLVGQGEHVSLLVQTAPQAPVTFAAFRGGGFDENGLNTISVRADARGYATVHFLVPPTARGQLIVQAGSPVAVGSQTFILEVPPPPIASDAPA